MEVIFDSRYLKPSPLEIKVARLRVYELPNPDDINLRVFPLNEYYYIINAPQSISDHQLARATGLARRATAFLSGVDDLDLNPAETKPDLDEKLARFTHIMEHVAAAEYTCLSRWDMITSSLKRVTPKAATLVSQPPVQESNFPGVMFTFNKNFSNNMHKQDRAVRKACVRILQEVA